MAATITILNLVSPQEVPVYSPVALTSKAFKAINHKELMREWTLDFFVTNLDNARKYLAPSTQSITLANGNPWLVPQTQFMTPDGQLFDISQLNQNSGADNTTETCGNHVSYRLNNYSLPAGYSFVGTVAALIQDMLIQSGAGFTVGLMFQNVVLNAEPGIYITKISLNEVPIELEYKIHVVRKNQ